MERDPVEEYRSKGRPGSVAVSSAVLCKPWKDRKKDEARDAGRHTDCRRPMGVFPDLGWFQLCRGLAPEGVGLGSLG